MKLYPFQYAMVYYIPDIGNGEYLNIGVMLYCLSERFFGIVLDNHTHRLNEAFVNFDSKGYLRFIKALRNSADKISKEISGLYNDISFSTIINRLFPDKNLSIQPGIIGDGLTHSPAFELDYRFKRCVSSRYNEAKREMLDDDKVYSLFENYLPKVARDIIQEREFSTDKIQIKFHHTYKNEKWHIIEPVSFDYKHFESIQSKSVKWLGNGYALKPNQEIGEITLLLGEPSNTTYMDAYNKAKLILDEIPIDHNLIEEDEYEDFAKDLQNKMKEDGIL